MFDFGIFCHVLHGDISGGAPSGYLKSFVLSFLFLYFLFSFFFFSSSLSLGPLYLWGPWTLSTHATQLLRHCSFINKQVNKMTGMEIMCQVLTHFIIYPGGYSDLLWLSVCCPASKSLPITKGHFG